LPVHKDSKLVVYNVGFKPEFLDKALMDSRYFTDLARLFLFDSLFEHTSVGNDLDLIGNDDSEIGDLYDRMYREFLTKNFGYIEILRSYLIELIIKIFRLYELKNSESKSRDKLHFDNAIRFMKDHYKSDIKLEDLAALTFFSPNYFCKRFKECTGMNVVEYIQKLRIEEACNLLKTTNMRIIDIGATVGYNDIKFFTKLFKKNTGKSPSEYKKL
jgi:YesN/AraC family two-component response regulator